MFSVSTSIYCILQSGGANARTDFVGGGEPANLFSIDDVKGPMYIQLLKINIHKF